MTTGFLWDATYITGGFLLTKVTAGFMLPMFPMLTGQPIIRIVSKGVLAWGVGWAGSMMLGKRAGALLMTGGFVEVINDAVRTYVAPFVPALAQEEMLEAYPELRAYPGLGYDYSNPYNVEMGVDEHENAV